MIHQNCQYFFEDIAYDTYNGMVLDGSEGDSWAGLAIHPVIDALSEGPCRQVIWKPKLWCSQIFSYLLALFKTFS